MSDTTTYTSDDARAAIYKGIVETAEELKDFNATSRAEGLRHLAEAFGWAIAPNNSH